MHFEIEMGPPPAPRYIEDRDQYERGFAFGEAKRYLLSAIELRRQVTEPCHDAFTAGWQDALGGKANRYAGK